MQTLFYIIVPGDIMLDFFTNAWPLLLGIFIVIVIVAIIRGVKRFLRDGGGAFRMETIMRNTNANLEALKQKSEALLKDADMVCPVTGDLVSPTKNDLNLFKTAVARRYKVAMFLIPNTTQVAYFFCKTDAGLTRRIENLLPNDRKRNAKWPYQDKATGLKLKFKI
jgi:hypothetical protein